jgi:hypothetical protein
MSIKKEKIIILGTSGSGKVNEKTYRKGLNPCLKVDYKTYEKI